MKRKREVEIVSQSLEAAGLEVSEAVKVAIAAGLKAVKSEKRKANRTAKAIYDAKKRRKANAQSAGGYNMDSQAVNMKDIPISDAVVMDEEIVRMALQDMASAMSVLEYVTEGMKRDNPKSESREYDAIKGVITNLTGGYNYLRRNLEEAQNRGEIRLRVPGEPSDAEAEPQQTEPNRKAAIPALFDEFPVDLSAFPELDPDAPEFDYKRWDAVSDDMERRVRAKRLNERYESRGLLTGGKTADATTDAKQEDTQ